MPAIAKPVYSFEAGKGTKSGTRGQRVIFDWGKMRYRYVCAFVLGAVRNRMPLIESRDDLCFGGAAIFVSYAIGYGITGGIFPR